MELTEKQEEGLQVAIRRYCEKEKYTVIAGYAGTGKSTLVKFIIEAIGLDPQTEVAYCSYTGKAAQVLINKGNPNATTLHKLLYKASPTPEGKYIFKKNKSIPYKVVVCDEVSMVPTELLNDLMAHNVYIIFCGDPAQLPPVSDDSDNHILDNPHVFLDEVMRQALDSGIIQVSMKIRNGETIRNFDSNDAKILPNNEFVTGMLEWADQILCATNATRTRINSMCRQLKGYTKPIVDGESLICLKNDWNTCSSTGAALTNGTIGTLKNIKEKNIYFPGFVKIPGNRITVIEGHFISDTGEDFGILQIDKQCILTGKPTLTPQQKYKLLRNKKFKDLIPYEFTYSYCLTTWKAQGSEFDKVLVLEEGFPYSEDEHRKFMYTAATRASKKLVMITKE